MTTLLMGGRLAGNATTRPERPPTPKPTSSPPARGTMISDSIELLEVIAHGAMGAVWLARHHALETEVAVKLVSPDASPGVDRDQLVARFRREAMLSARLRSANTVQVFDHGVSDDGAPYIVMELLEGATLGEWLSTRGTLSLRETAIIVAQLCKALHKAHAMGIVHRDIKPENVFVLDAEYELFVKILDFGIAKRIGDTRREVTQTGVAMGTPGYISPEQALNAKHVDHRADLWSLGALAYRLITGRVPYGADGDEPWWLRLNREELTPVRDLAPQMPRELDAWFRRALHPKPHHRFDDARDMADALLDIARRGGSEPPSAREAAEPREQAAPPEDAPPSSARHAQFGLFDLVEDETRDGTLIIETKPRVSAPLVSSPWPPRPVPTSRARARDRMTTALIAAIFVSMLTALVAASILQLH